MKTINITLSIAICFSLFHCNEEKNNLPPRIVNPLENRTLQAGFGMDTMDIQKVFNDPNDDKLFFNAKSSDDEVVSATIFQNSQLIIREGHAGKAKITLTANDAHRTTATDTLEVTIIKIVPDNQPPMVVNPLENKTLQAGFGTDTMDIQKVFNDPNDDELTFNAHSSDDSVIAVTILQNNQLVISEVGVGIATITLTADDGQEGTVSDEFQVTVTERESLLACDFEVCPYDLLDRGKPVQIARELINVRATVLAHYGGKPGILGIRDGLHYKGYLVPCRPLDKEFIVDKKEVLISGYVLNCAGGLTLPQIKGSLGNLFKLTDIRNVPENQPPMVVNPLENRTLQEGFGTDMVDIQNVFNDPNDDALTFNAHSSNDEVVSVTILQNNQLVISEVGTGIATITLTADDGQGTTASTTFEVTIIGNMIVLTPPDLAFTEGFRGTGIFLHTYFRSTNGDELNFIASTSDPSVVTVNIGQNSVYGATLIINGVGNGIVTITITANDSRGETVSTTFKLTVIERVSLLACDFEVCPYGISTRGTTVKTVRELINVRAKIVKINIPHHEYGITIDSFYLENPGPTQSRKPGRSTNAYINLLAPCSLDKKFRVNEKQIIISGYVLSCSAELILPFVRGHFGRLFKITDIQEFSSNTN